MDEIRLEYLIGKVRNGNATIIEKDEYMKFLYEQNRISEEHYKNYLNNKNKENLLKYGILSGLGLLTSMLIINHLNTN